MSIKTSLGTESGDIFSSETFYVSVERCRPQDNVGPSPDLPSLFILSRLLTKWLVREIELRMHYDV